MTSGFNNLIIPKSFIFNCENPFINSLTKSIETCDGALNTIVRLLNKEKITVTGLHTITFDGNNYSYDDLIKRKLDIVLERNNLQSKLNRIIK